jgi:hypothetical protein
LVSFFSFRTSNGQQVPGFLFKSADYSERIIGRHLNDKHHNAPFKTGTRQGNVSIVVSMKESFHHFRLPVFFQQMQEKRIKAAAEAFSLPVSNPCCSANTWVAAPLPS